MIEFVTGDLFDTSWGFDALAHGVNCRGAMGAGIAVEFRRRWPDMYKAYALYCSLDFLSPGHIMPWVDEDDFLIYNLATQDFPGRDATLQRVQTCLTKLADLDTVSHVGLPRLGAGIGGLDWEDVKQVMIDCLSDAPNMFTIVSL